MEGAVLRSIVNLMKLNKTQQNSTKLNKTQQNSFKEIY